MTFQRRIVTTTIALVCLCTALPLAQTGGSNLFTDPSQRYSIEFPKGWNWMIVEGASEAISAFYHPKREAAIVVERFRMKQALAQADITDVFAQIETDVLKENQPYVKDVNARVLTQGPKRLVQIDYRRPGIGEPGKVEEERVRQFSFPIGGNLYRITCFSTASQFVRYEATCQWAAESLKSAEELASKK